MDADVLAKQGAMTSANMIFFNKCRDNSPLNAPINKNERNPHNDILPNGKEDNRQ